MQRLDLVGTITGSRFAAGTTHLELVAGGTAILPTVTAINYVTRETVTLLPLAGQVAAVSGIAVHGQGRTAMTVDGLTGSVLTDAIVQARGLAGTASVSAFLSETTSLASQVVELVAATVGPSTYLYAARPDGTGIAIHELAADNTLTARGSLPDSAAIYAGGVSAMVTATVGTATFVVAGAYADGGITAFRIGVGGSLEAVASVGAAEGVGLPGVTVLRAVAAAGETWVIAGAATASTLTVFRVGGDGSLTLTDQIMDDLGTRFAAVTALDAIAVDGRVFVAAAGADLGLSLFALLPGGQLLHLSSLADSATTSLSHISSIEMLRVGGELQVIVGSAAEAGLTILRLNLSAIGQMIGGAGNVAAGGIGADLLFRAAGQGTLDAGSGDDILVDGAGEDSLRGGSGADIFVLTQDGHRDVILDFDPASDRIDLSLWPMLRNSGQLVIDPTATGAVLGFGSEVLEIRTASGTGLTVALVRALALLGQTRIAWRDADAADPLAVTGTGGNDTLLGGNGNDTLSGLGGDDLFLSGIGADWQDGGDGCDTVSYAAETAGVMVDLSGAAPGVGAATGDRFSGIEAVIGTSFDDRLSGDGAANALYGGAGNDTLTGRGGADTLDGGAGLNTADYSAEGSRVQVNLSTGTHGGAAAGDVLVAIEGVIGTAWGDRLIGDGAGNVLTGSGGDDWLDGLAGNDTLFGGDGQDSVKGGTGDDVLWGGAGDDILPGEDGNDLIYGGDGADAVGGGADNDTLYGDGGTDEMGGGEGFDLLYGGDGNDNLSGGYGADTLYGGADNDTLAGSYGNDQVHGDTGNDSLGGGVGRDTLWGGDGNDQLGGGDDADTLYGGFGDDFLAGGAGNDVLWGGAGTDRLNGGSGDDVLWGGAGADVFIFATHAAGERDIVGDFENGSDRLQFAGVGGAGQQGRFASLTIQSVMLDGLASTEIIHAGHSVILAGIAPQWVDPGDFLFV